MTILANIVAALLGLVLGSLANLLADDLPRRVRPTAPHCAHCEHTRRPIAWSGLTAYLFKGRRCHNCGQPLSRRHLILEVALAVAFVYLWNRYGLVLDLLFIGLYVWIAALVTVTDLEHRLILNVVMGPAILLALIEAALTPRLPFLTALKGGGIGFGFVFGIYLFGELFRQIAARARGQSIDEIAFGYGDVTLATFAGLVVGSGFGGVSLMLLLMIFIGGAVALLYLVYRLIRRNYDLFTAIPYGPNIIVSMLAVLLWRSEIIELLL